MYFVTNRATICGGRGWVFSQCDPVQARLCEFVTKLFEQKWGGSWLYFDVNLLWFQMYCRAIWFLVTISVKSTQTWLSNSDMVAFLTTVKWPICIKFSPKHYIWEQLMYRSIGNSHIPSSPGHTPGIWPSPLPREWDGAFDHNTRGVGNLIRCRDFMFRAALLIKTACVCLQMLKQVPYPSVIIGEPIFNVADITILFVTSGKTLETDISAQMTSNFLRKSGPEVGHLTTEFSLDVGHLNGFLAPGWEIWPQLNWKVQMPGGMREFELISTLVRMV